MQQLYKTFLKTICTSLLLFLLVGCDCEGVDSPCYSANDLGTGGSIEIEANLAQGSSKLLVDGATSSQISAWTYTGFQTVGKVVGEGGAYTTIPISGSISGNWQPWGLQGESKPSACIQTQCSQYDSTCLNNKTALGLGKGLGGINVEPTADNLGCFLSSGIGLYGLISINGDDPNETAEIAANPPPNQFYTFHFYNFIPISTSLAPPPSGVTLSETAFTVGSLISCTPTNNDLPNPRYKCTPSNSTTAAGTAIPSGNLYVKILDSYYSDNTGSYIVTFSNGVYKMGFIEKAFSIFTTQMKEVTQYLLGGMLQDLRFTALIRVLLILYVTLTGVFFLFGITKMNQGELLIQLFKVGLIATLLTNSITAYNFFNTYLISWFQGIAEAFSKILMEALFAQGQEHSPTNAAEVAASVGGYLAVFDVVIDQIVSKALNVKIWSLLFTKYIYFIFLLYILIFILLVTIFEAIMLYLTALFQITLLTIIFPIFIVMILFKLTSPMFQNWLKSLISSGLIIILTTATVGLMLRIVEQTLEGLLMYKVCWQWIVGWARFCLGILFWYPESMGEVKSALDIGTYFSVLFACIILQLFLKQIPSLADSLSNALFSPSSTLAQSIGMPSDMISNTIGQLRSFNVKYGLGKLTGKVTHTDEEIAKGGIWNKVVRGVGQLLDAKAILGKGYDKGTKKLEQIEQRFGAGSSKIHQPSPPPNQQEKSAVSKQPSPQVKSASKRAKEAIQEKQQIKNPIKNSENPGNINRQ